MQGEPLAPMMNQQLDWRGRASRRGSMAEFVTQVSFQGISNVKPDK